jgi:hypothetical protein
MRWSKSHAISPAHGISVSEIATVDKFWSDASHRERMQLRHSVSARELTGLGACDLPAIAESVDF